MQTQYWYTSSDSLEIIFNNPYYVAPVTELIFNGSDTINLVNIPDDATKVELFRDSVYLTNLIITDAAASVKIGTSGSYNVRIYKGSYLLVETPVVVVDTISSASISVVEPVARLVATDGYWNGSYDYLYFETTSEGRFLYDLVEIGTTNTLSAQTVEYDKVDKKWYDVGVNNPDTWGQDNMGTNTTAFPTDANMQTQFWYNSGTKFQFQFDNPYYVAPVTELIFNGSDTINLVNIPEDATKVELFRDGISLGPLLIDGTAASVTIGTSRSYNARIYKVVDGLSYLLIETPDENYVAPPPDPVAIIVATGGSWENNYDYLYFETTSEGRFLYRMVIKGDTDRHSGSDQWDLEYDTSETKWYDVGSSSPHVWGIDNSGANTSDFSTAGNTETHYWYDNIGTLKIQFTDPYYVAPPEPVARIVATGGSWENNDDYLYFETTLEGRYLYGLVGKGSTARQSGSDM